MYGDVLIVDGTYGINDLKIPLYTIFGHGPDGKGKVMTHALVTRETTANLKFVLESYKGSTEMVPHCVVMDKDCSEIVSSKSVFPDAQVLLCAFHTLKTFKKVTAARVHCPKTKERLRELLLLMVSGKTKENFDRSEEELLEIAPPVFRDYYQKNWGNCPEMWATYAMDEHRHLGNTTTNRIESFHQKLKNHLRKDMTVAECVSGLLRVHRSMQDTDSFRKKMTKVATFYNAKGLSDIELLYSEQLTKYAASAVIRSIRASQDCTLKAEYETSATTCGCSTYRTKGLPCKHIFHFRTGNGLPLYDATLVEDRWHEPSVETISPGEVVISSSQRAKKLSKTQKYKEAMAVCKEICDIISEHSMEKFDTQLAQLDHLLDQWKLGNDMEMDVLTQVCSH